MRSNQKKLKEKCIDQNKTFKQLDKQKNYSEIHHSHYDWWAFPLDRRSSYGDEYKVFPTDKQNLSKDEQFIEALRSNAILVCKAWGYDLVKGENILNPQEDQKWQDWPIRLYKMSGSLELFNQNDLLANSVKFAKKLISQDCQFSYGPKNLKPYYAKFDQNGVKKENQNNYHWQKHIKTEKTEENKTISTQTERKIEDDSVSEQLVEPEKVEQAKVHPQSTQQQSALPQPQERQIPTLE